MSQCILWRWLVRSTLTSGYYIQGQRGRPLPAWHIPHPPNLKQPYVVELVGRLLTLATVPRNPATAELCLMWSGLVALSLDFSYLLMPQPGFKPTSVRELHLFEGPLKERSINWATPTAASLAHIIHETILNQSVGLIFGVKLRWKFLYKIVPRSPPTFIHKKPQNRHR